MKLDIFAAQAVDFEPEHQSPFLFLVLGVGRWCSQDSIEGSAGVAARLWPIDWCGWRRDARWQR